MAALKFGHRCTVFFVDAFARLAKPCLPIPSWDLVESIYLRNQR